MQRIVCKPRKAKQMEEDCSDSVCRHCGKPIEKQIAGQRRIYCSEECRSSATRTTISGTGFGEKRIQKKL